MSFADNSLNTAIKLIEKFGSTLTLNKASSSSYNPATGKVETVAGANINIKSHFSAYTSEEIKGLIQTGDIKAIVYYDSAIIYTDKDTITIDTIKYNIINVMPTKAQDKTIIIELQLRR